jgi:hypothetical protein
MAINATNTRRGVLTDVGAYSAATTILTGGITLAGAVKSPEIPDASLFTRRLTAFHAANAEFVERVRHAVPDEAADDLCKAVARAYEQLLDAPAPDMAAVAEKLNALLVWSAGSEIEKAEIKLLAADLQRLRAGRA